MATRNFKVFGDNESYTYNETDDLFRDCHYLQSIDWYKCHANNLLAITYDNDTPIARSIIRIKNIPARLGFIAFIDRGPIGISQKAIIDHLNEIISYFKNTSCAYIQCSPIYYGDDNISLISSLLSSNGWNPINATQYLYGSTITINLAQDIDAIKSSFRRSLKTQINKSEKLGITIQTEPDITQIQDFVYYYNEMAQQRGLSHISDNISQYIASSNRNGTTKVLLAYLDKKLISGAVLVQQGSRIIYEWGMNTLDPELKSLPLAHKMHWEAIKWAKTNGYAVYDMGGFWLSKGSNDSINNFKLGFSKTVQNITPEFYYTVNMPRFMLVNILIKLRKILTR